MSKTDLQLKQDIEAELVWDPMVNAAQIGVTVDDGTVSLLGFVDTYPQKWAAEDAAKRVAGVRSVAKDLEVKLHQDHARSDSEIAAAALDAMKWDVFVPSAVTASVHKGIITLEGQVNSNHEREAAERAVRNLMGVVSVYDAISLKPDVSPSDVKEKVGEALRRQATRDVSSIQIETSGSKVTLTGHASSWQSMEDAANAAWAAPGVTEVHDRLKLQTTS